jgi:hypothetical protein
LKDRRLDLLGIRYFIGIDKDTRELESEPNRFARVFSEGDIRIFENRSALNRAFFVPAAGIEVIAGREAQLTRVADPAFDPANSVVLPERPRFEDAGELGGPSRVSGFVQTMNEIRFQADVNTPGVLVVSETNFPGWAADIDGNPAEVLLANYNFIGVPVDPGSHNVTVTYRPQSFRVGAGISVLCWMVVIAAAAYDRRFYGASRPTLSS